MNRIQFLWFLLIAISFGLTGSQLAVATESSSIRRADTLPAIGSVHVGKEKVTASVNTKTKLLKAELHYTVDKLPGSASSRKWLRKPATITQDSIVSDLPPADATVWFLTLVDERNTLVSSTLVFSSTEKEHSKTDAAVTTSGGVMLLDLPEENPNYYFEAEIELSRPEATAAVVVRCSKEFVDGQTSDRHTQKIPPII